MEINRVTNNKRIAKNTLLLYVRMLVLLVVSLYTSRVVLQALGVEDYGVYNVVGGFVAMFNVLSGSLSASISRFITYELGKTQVSEEASYERLKNIFSTAVNIQIIMSLIIFVVGASFGLWMVNNVLNIDSERLYAANWVLLFSIMTFAVHIVALPYNATIIAHEKMSAFAYISILEALLKLMIAFLLMVSPWDKLVLYGGLLMGVSVLVSFVYCGYCIRHFKEARYRFFLDKTLFKQMANFAGWNFFSSICSTLNTQGLNMLMNMFFGVSVNAARGVAVQIEAHVTQFASNFTKAINPQITKNYAAGNIADMIDLVGKGTKYSFFIMYVFIVPIVMEVDYLLKIWLVQVPEHSSIFVRLTLFAALINMMANSILTAIQATGHIKRYSIEVNLLSIFVFPLSLLAFYLGSAPYMAYVVLIGIRLALHVIRIRNLRLLVEFSVRKYVNEAWVKTSLVAGASFVIPMLIRPQFDESLLSFITVVSISVLSTISCIWLIGLDSVEKKYVVAQVKKIMERRKKKAL